MPSETPARLASSRQHSLSVFVASTQEDLVAYRAAARLAILDAGCDPVMMEHFGAQVEPTVAACQNAVANSDLVVLIVGYKRGWVPTREEGGDGSQSIVRLELAHARLLRKPIYILMASASWPGNRWEDDADARAAVKSFRDTVNQPAAFFDAEPEIGGDAGRLPLFQAKVRDILQRHKLSLQNVSARSEAVSDFRVDTVVAGLSTGSRIPLVGPGIFGDGPLGAAALVRAMLDTNADDLDDTCLATASEYCERLLGSRWEFLQRFEASIRAQSAAVGSADIFDLLLRLKKSPLFISASCDRLLEDNFKRAGISYVVLSHVLRSYDGENDGKILVERSDDTVRLEAASDLVLSDEDRVIYKPVGSPIHAAALDPDLEIDTVVATEADHFLLFRSLQNQLTGVPTAVVTRMQRWPLVYIGYALDVWQFRLLTQVLRAVGRGPRGGATPFAIREPRTVLEELSWQQIGVSLIAMEPNLFARRGLAAQTDAAA